ncbi:MAG: zinc-ribbon domain-containing protein [Candidatus Bathyarchaeia archaeon]
MQFKKSRSLFLVTSIKAFFLITLILLIIPAVKGMDGVMVRTDRSVYYAGDPVKVIFQSSHPPDIMGVARIIVSGPAGTATAGTMNVLGGVLYSTTISGSFISIPGYYTVRVVIDIIVETYEGIASFQVIPRTPFDFTLSISPSSLTVKKGETARFTWSVSYSDPIYQGTTFTWDISGLDSSMRVNVGRGTLTITTTDATPPGVYPFTFTLSAKGITRSATATLIVEALFDYSISISPLSQTITIGEKTLYTITVNLVSGTAQPVSLTLSGLPSDVPYVFTPTSGTPSFTSTLTVDAGASSSPGTYTLTVTATGGGLTRTAITTLTINEKDFKLSLSPETVTVDQGDSISLQIKVEPMGAFNEPVSLTVSGVPSGVDSKFTVPSGVPPFTANLNLNIPLSTPEGAYTLTVGGEGGGKSHSIKVTLNIEKKPFTLTIEPKVEGVKVKVFGALTPPTPGTKIALVYHSHSHPEGEEGETVTHEANVKPDGSFSDEFSPKTLGEWSVKAELKDNNNNVLAVSEIKYFMIEESFMNKLTLLAGGNLLFLILPLLAVAIAAFSAISIRKREGIKAPSKQASAYCQNCGAPLTIEDKFCPSCGARQKLEETEAGEE